MSVGAALNARFENYAATIGGLGRWRRRGVGFLAGAATAAAFAPFYVLPLMVAGFSVLIFLIDGAVKTPRAKRSAFGIGWWFGFGYFLIGVYWMSFSFFVQADQFAWMAPFVVLGMPAFLALFPAMATALAAAFWRPGWRRVLVFAGAWMLLEYARGHVLTGLPWNLAGQALAGTALTAQTSAWYGVYGLSLVTVLLAAAPAAFPGKILRGGALTAGGAVLLAVIGVVRLSLPDPGVHTDAYVRIVQPNIPQREKIDPDLWGRNFLRNLELSSGGFNADEGAVKARVFVIWPENAAPLLDEYQNALERVSQTLPDNAVLIAGGVRREVNAARTDYFNSVMVIPQTPQGRRAVLYHDKNHLVPFGEYLPFRGILQSMGLAQLAPYEDGFAAGPRPRTLNAGGPSFTALVCYEVIFPGDIYRRGDRPDWLVNITNDAWFGDTSGPRQHLDQARLRSIELGLPMARSANTGVSVLIDAKGRYIGVIPLYQSGVIDAPLPKPLAPTLYGRTGDALFGLMLALVLGIALGPVGGSARAKRGS